MKTSQIGRSRKTWDCVKDMKNLGISQEEEDAQPTLVLMVNFQDNLGRPVREFQTILDSAAARDDGCSSSDSQNSETCKAPVKSPPSTQQHSIFYRLDVFPVTQSTTSKH